MRVTFAGSGGSVVTKESCCPCILIDRDIMIDCGSGSLKNLRHLDVNLTELKKILITHYHADHVGDLAALLWAIEMEGSRDSLEIMGYNGIENFVTELLKLFNTPSEFTVFNVKLKPLMGDDEVDEIRTCMTVHKPTNLAYRIERMGRSVCYTGDTAFYEPLASFASGCDLLIHDSMFMDDQKEIAALTNHSTASQAGRIAEMANVGTLVLFHLFPLNTELEEEYVKQAAKEFSGKILIAKDFQTIEI